jgi:hypothetical protein
MAKVLQLPRAFQISLVFVFDADDRSDEDLMRYLLDRVSPALSLGAYGRGAACHRVAVPAGAAFPPAAGTLPPPPQPS